MTGTWKDPQAAQSIIDRMFADRPVVDGKPGFKGWTYDECVPVLVSYMQLPASVAEGEYRGILIQAARAVPARQPPSADELLAAIDAATRTHLRRKPRNYVMVTRLSAKNAEAIRRSIRTGGARIQLSSSLPRSFDRAPAEARAATLAYATPPDDYNSTTRESRSPLARQIALFA